MHVAVAHILMVAWQYQRVHQICFAYVMLSVIRFVIISKTVCVGGTEFVLLSNKQKTTLDIVCLGPNELRNFT